MAAHSASSLLPKQALPSASKKEVSRPWPPVEGCRGTWSQRIRVARLGCLDADRSFVDEEMANTLIWLFRDWLLGRRCTACGSVYTAPENAEDRCPFCGAPKPDWAL